MCHIANKNEVGIHWLLMGALLSLVQHGRDLAQTSSGFYAAVPNVRALSSMASVPIVTLLYMQRSLPPGTLEVNAL